MYWKEASKFLMSKHQQVQLLEAAAILVGMDSNARSLPEEKALWPAAVSPPSSGLLGCEHFNFDTLMASKARNAAMQNDPAAAARMPYGTSAPPGPSVADMTMRARSMDGLHAPSKKPMYHPPTPVAVDEPAEEGDESGELSLGCRLSERHLHCDILRCGSTGRGHGCRCYGRGSTRRRAGPRARRSRRSKLAQHVLHRLHRNIGAHLTCVTQKV